MKRHSLVVAATLATIIPAFLAVTASAQSLASVASVFPQKLRGAILIPESSIENIEDIGVNFHTNHMLFVVPDATSPQGETPATIRAVYNLPSTGGSGVIAIIDAYDYPTALNDFNVFSQQFGLPKETSTNATSAANKVFQVVYATGTKPKNNASWNEEAALDIEWAHAMAPNAKIVLVEAKSASSAALDKAVATATGLTGVKEISMSYSSSETANEANSDSKYVHSGIVFFASSGDTGGVNGYPSVSPNVVSAGGTKINRNGSGVFTSETGWTGSGGGPSKYEARPSYQSSISSIVGTKRGVPDISFDADPNSGVSVYDSTPYKGNSGWLVFGGTSVSSPALTGIVNLCSTLNSNFASSSAVELARIYAGLNSVNFRDIVSGTAGANTCKVGWDYVTGVGSSITTTGK